MADGSGLFDATADPSDEPIRWTPPEPCPTCGSAEANCTPKGPHYEARCAGCGRHIKFVSKSVLGVAASSLRTRPDIKPSQRARILERDNYTCVLCHRADLPLDVGHLLSVKEGTALGATEAEMYDDENLATMCTPCNSGLSSRSVSPRLAVLLFFIIRAGIDRRKRAS